MRAKRLNLPVFSVVACDLDCIKDFDAEEALTEITIGFADRDEAREGHYSILPDFEFAAENMMFLALSIYALHVRSVTLKPGRKWKYSYL